MIADIFYPKFSLRIIALACFIQKIQNCLGVSHPHLHQGIICIYIYVKCKYLYIYICINIYILHKYIYILYLGEGVGAKPLNNFGFFV